MRWIVLVVAILGGLPRTVLAGEIFGIINEAGQPVPNARVAVTISNKTYTTNTDARGSYRVIVPERGKARLTVTVDSRASSIDVFSSERGVRYDLTIVPGPEPQLRRK